MAHSSGGQIAAFFQDFVRHGDLAQVVQISATAQRHDGLGVQAEMAAQIAGMTGQAVTVAFGIRIATLHAQAQRAQYRFCRLQFVGEFFQLKQRLDASKKFLREDRLVQKIVGARFNSQHPVLAIGEACDQNERDQPRGGIRFKFPAQLVTRLAGHDHIRQDQVGRAAQDFSFRLNGIGNRHYVIAVAASSSCITPMMSRLSSTTRIRAGDRRADTSPISL